MCYWHIWSLVAAEGLANMGLASSSLSATTSGYSLPYSFLWGQACAFPLGAFLTLAETSFEEISHIAQASFGFS